MSDETRGWRESIFRWTVIEGGRLSVAGIILGGILLLLAVLLVVNLFPTEPGDPVFLLLSAFLGGNLTLITVVIAINQLVFSRELGSPGELESRTRNAVAYRDEVQSVLDRAVTPVMPGSFLLVLHENLGERAESLGETVPSVEGVDGERADEFAEEIDALVRALQRDVQLVTEALDGPNADEQIFGVIAATLGTTQAEQLYDLARIETRFADRLSETQAELFESIREHLLHVDVARKYFRTVYIEKELSFLSRIMLVVGVPAQFVVAATLAVYDIAALGEFPAGVVVAATLVAMVACFAPLAVLASFVLRLSWVAQRNASVMPFAASEKDYTLF